MNTHFPFEWLVIKTLAFWSPRNFIYVSGQTLSSALLYIQHSTSHSDGKITEFKVIIPGLDLKGRGPSGQSNTVAQGQV